MLLLDTQFHKGSLIEKVSGTAMTAVNAPLRWDGKKYTSRYNGTSSYVPISTVPAFGNSNFSVSIKFISPNSGGVRSLIGGAAGCFEVYVTNLGEIVSGIRGGVINGTASLLKAGVEYTLTFIKSSTNRTTYLNGVSVQSVTDINNYIAPCIYIGRGSNFNIGSISSVRIFNHALTASEITAEYNYSLSLRGTNNLIRNIQTIKPTDLSRQKPSLVAAYNMVAQKNVLVDISGNLKNGTCTSCINTKDGILLSGVNSKVALGNIGSVKSVSFRFKPNSTTCKILEKAANSGLIFNNSGTLSAADFSNIYVNGVAGTTLVVGQWHNVTLTSATDVAFTAATLGLNNTTYGAFEIADLRFYNKTLSAQEVKDYHNQFIKVLLQANFQSDPADGTSITPVGWMQGTGVYKVSEATASDTVLKTIQKGTKYLECTTAGTIAIENNAAYGTWEWDWYKGTGSNLITIGFISSTPGVYTSSSGYSFWITNAEAVDVEVNNGAGGSSAITLTTPSYVLYSRWYRIKVIRNSVGVFTFLMRGGDSIPTSGYDGWTLISTAGAGGGGSNPAVNNIYTTSNYLVLDLDPGDRFTNLTIYGGIKV